ncbi:MAG TPA: hypothetical protein G4O15_12690 [Dehalococcoidia bacterium]|nr:hypothetical protein [Dehalococcoidia bacterium]
MDELKYGWVGKILKVDLTDRTITTLPTSDYAPDLIGGRGIGAMLYWEEVPPECKALDPENALIFMTGPATGTLAPSAGRFCVSFKTPVPEKEFYCMSLPSGHWGPELKFAGYDGIVVKGKASEPVYLYINDGQVEIRSARYLWGMTLTNLMLQLYKQHGPKTRILGIGPAGENLCREAVIISDHEHATGLGGAGAVMGSKNLKAIAVNGTGAVKVARPQELIDLWWYFSRLVTRKPGEEDYPSMHRSLCDGLYHGAHIRFCPGHPERPQDDETYFKNMGLDDPICLMNDAINKGILKLKWGGCYACPVNCALTWQSSDIDIPSGSGQCNEWMSWATYEWQGYKKVCGIPALQFSSYMDDLGLSITNTLGYHFFWFFELVKLGIFTEENTGVPLDKPWTDEFIKGILEKFAYRKGIFDQAAEGHERFLKNLSEQYPAVKPIYERVVNHPGYHVHWEVLGGGFNMPSPGSIVHAVEPRTWAFRPSHLIMIGAGASPQRGAERRNVPRVPPSLKANMPTTILRHNLDLNSDCITYCSWAGMPPTFSKYTSDGIGDQSVGAKVFSAVTGINMSHDEMMEAMNPVANIERCIHMREGRRKEDDLYNDATYASPAWAHTSKQDFIEAMEEYYTLRGWDPETGIPRRSTLEKQGLKKIADDLESKYGVTVPA